MSSHALHEHHHRIDRLLDAIDLIKEDERQQALVILRQLIREDKDFEDAWLWMSVAVEDVDESIVCLENVLRINPNNPIAAGALYRLRGDEMQSEQHRAQLRTYRDVALGAMWLLIGVLLMAIFVSSFTDFLVGA